VAGIVRPVQVTPSVELAALRLAFAIATNLLLPAAKHFQFPDVGRSKDTQDPPSEEYRPKVPELGVNINFPLLAIDAPS
jgi:hypothetical protein